MAVTHPRWQKHSILALAAALALALLLVFLLRPYIWASQTGRSQAPPPAVVAAATAEQKTWQARLSTIGTLEAERGVEITTAAAGIVESIRFSSGDDVERGALIVQIDAAADRARLATLTAQLEQAQSDLARSRVLRKGGAISVADAEQAATAVEALRAQIDEQRALIDDKRVEAPFKGELGIRQVDLGEFVQPGEPIVSLQQITPILVNFTLPERHHGRLQRGQQIQLSVEAWPDRCFNGAVTAIDPQIDPRTRNFQVQGRLSNEERLLRPGMFAELQVILAEQREVIAVPATAISYSPAGDSVFVVQRPQAAASKAADSSDAKDAASDSRAVSTVTRVPVQIGERRGTQIAVLKGIEAGDVVVTAGQLKLFEGAPVRISPTDASTDTTADAVADTATDAATDAAPPPGAAEC